MDNYIDDIVCELLDNEPIADPTQAIENLMALHDVYATYGEQPEIIQLTGLTKDDVNKYLNGIEDSLESMFSAIRKYIVDSVKKGDNLKLLGEHVESLKRKLKPNTTYSFKAICNKDSSTKCKLTDFIHPCMRMKIGNDIPDMEKFEEVCQQHFDEFALCDIEFKTNEFDDICRFITGTFKWLTDESNRISDEIVNAAKRAQNKDLQSSSSTFRDLKDVYSKWLKIVKRPMVIMLSRSIDSLRKSILAEYNKRG